MKKVISLFCAAALVLSTLSGCGGGKQTIKIGVSFGVGPALRWEQEAAYMEARAQELDAEIEVRLNRTDEPKNQQEDCFELIDSGIDVLVLTPRDVTKVGDILDYAREKKVPVISYARVVLGQQVDLFVGYDSSRIGQDLGRYLSEMVYEGDYLILWGDPGDNNATLLGEGAMRYIEALGDSINIIGNEAVNGWSPDEAKKIVLDTVGKNGNHVDAILAPNDKIAGACAEALAELGVTEHVVITGMDAEPDAARRIVAGTQDVTIYMDLKELATTAIDQAVKLAKGEKPDVNSPFDNQSGETINANLITGRLITAKNIDSILIESGYLTREQVYGE